MDGAWFIPLAPLKRHIIGIASLATGAVIFTTVVVAVVTRWLLPSLPWAVCAALGAVSPPGRWACDPVVVGPCPRGHPGRRLLGKSVHGPSPLAARFKPAPWL